MYIGGAATEAAFASGGVGFKEVLPFVSGIDLHSDINRQRMASASDINYSDVLVADVNIGVVEDADNSSECDTQSNDECALPK